MAACLLLTLHAAQCGVSLENPLDPRTASGVIAGLLAGVIPAGTSGGCGEPTDPGSLGGLVLWLKADSLAQADGSAVTSWTDASGSGNTVTAGGAPQFFLNVINGLPVIRFNGTSHRLLKAPAVGTGNQYTWTAVARRASPFGTNQMILQVAPPACTNGHSFYFQGTNVLRTDRCGDGGSINDTLTLFTTAGEVRYLGARYDGSQATNFVDGELENTLNYVMTFTPTNFYVGSDSSSANYFSGDIAEILFFNRALTENELKKVDYYVSDKYGLPFSGACPI